MFHGSIPALVTPFQDGKPDLKAYAEFVEWQIASGSHGLVPCGTTGEAATLEPEEHRDVVRECVVQSAGRVPVIAGAGSNATHRAVALCEMMKAEKVDAVLVAAPWYNKPCQEGIYAHFAKISQVGVPIVVYNVPGRTVVDISVETIGRIAKLPNVVGLKDATGKIFRVPQQHEACGDDFVQLSGDDPSAVEFFEAGGNGCISVTANVLPRECAAVQDAMRAGDFDKARMLDMPLQAAHKAMFADASPAPAKYVLAKAGFMAEELRLPMVPCSEAARETVDAALAGFQIGK